MALTRVHTDLINGDIGTGGGVAEELQVDTFTGDGTTVTFGLTRLPDHANNTQVYISGVYQQKDTYTVSGLDLTFSEAPAIGESIEAVVAYVNPMYSGDHVKKSGDTMTGDLIVDANVGIGTDSPIELLHANGESVSGLQLTTDPYTNGTVFKVQMDGASYIYNKENAMLRFGTNNLERMRIDSSGVVNVANGITFGAGTDALDDYEEGTFNLHFLDAPGFSNTAGDDYNKYVKINNRVSVKGYFALSGVSPSTSSIRINGLPFNSTTDDLAVGVYLNGKGSASGSTFCVFNRPSSNDFYIYFNGSTTDNNAVPATYSNVGAIKGHFELSYFTD